MTRLLTPTCLVAVISLCAAALPAQDRDFVARYKHLGKEAKITRSELALEFARRYGNEERGKAALEHLLERALVLEAAQKKAISAPSTAVDQRLEQLGKMLASQGKNLDSYLRQINLSRKQMREAVEVTILQDVLIAKASALASTSEVTPAQRLLWMKQTRRKAKIELDPNKLQRGIVAAWGKTQLSSLDLGQILLQRADRKNELKFAQQIVLRKIFTHEADRLNIVVTEQDRRQEVERRRRKVESDPRYGNVPYEQFLRANGTSMEELTKSPVMIAMIQQRKIIERLHSDSSLRKELEANRAAINKRLGPQRHLQFVLVRALEKPNDFIKLTFEEALKRAEEAKKRASDGMNFADVARIYSDDPYTKINGGDIGLVTQGADNLPAAVLDRAFSLLPLRVSKPIRGPKGYYLVMVKNITPPPEDPVLIRRMRSELNNKYLQEVLRAAEIELVEG